MSKITDTQEYKNLEWSESRVIKDFLDIVNKKNETIRNLSDKIDSLANISPAQELKAYTPIPTIFKDKIEFGWTKRDEKGNIIKELACSIQDLDKWVELNTPIYEENRVICENNRKLKDLTFTILKKIGLKDSIYDFETPRAKTRKWHTPNWVGEINKLFITSCKYSWNSCLSSIASGKKQIQDFINKENQKELLDKQKEEATLKEKSKLVFLSEVNSKYKMSIPVELLDKNSVIDHFLKLDKYLRLGHYLRLNRENWDDGPDYAETGLDGFDVVTDKDVEISNEIRGLIDNWDGDGRVFRDCEYNYDYIFYLCEPGIYSDYCHVVNL